MLEYYTNIDKGNLLETDSNEIKDINSRVNILKDEFTLEKSDYEKLKCSQQNNELNAIKFDANEKEKIIHENKNIYNMSLNSLFNKISKVSIDIIEDLTIYKGQKNKNINNFFIIFTKDDRLMYVGILLLLLSLCLWFIDITK